MLHHTSTTRHCCEPVLKIKAERKFSGAKMSKSVWTINCKNFLRILDKTNKQMNLQSQKTMMQTGFPKKQAKRKRKSISKKEAQLKLLLTKLIKRVDPSP